MPDITTSVRYLAKLPLYEKEKPFSLLPSANLHSEENFVATNLEFEVHDGILVRDLREHLDQFTLEKSGFEIKHHVPNITVLDTAEQMNDYQEEIKAWLKFLFKAEHVTCYEIRVRISIQYYYCPAFTKTRPTYRGGKTFLFIRRFWIFETRCY